MKRAAMVALGIVLIGAACSTDGDGQSTTSGSGGASQEIGEADPGEVSRSEPGHLRVTVEGDLSIEFSEDVDLRIVVIRHPEITVVRFLSVGIEQLQSLPDGTAFRVAFDLAGAFDGEGSYTLPAVGSTAANPDDPGAVVAQGVSKPFLIFSPGGLVTDNPEALGAIRSFENALEECAVEVTEDDGGAGSVDCPEVTDAEGNGQIRLHMEWATA